MQNACVEVATLPDGGRDIRDSQNREGGLQFYPKPEWTAFVAAVPAGEFDA